MALFFITMAFAAFTVKYFFPPRRKWLWYAMLFFLLCTPTTWFLTNWLLSDLLFIVQTYWLLALFIFIVKQKSWTALALWAAILYTTLHVRHSAMLYPVFFIPLFLLLKGRIRWVAPVVILAACIPFYVQTRINIYKKAHLKQFSTGFGGWTLANNVFYALPHIDLKPETIKDSALRQFHEFVLQDSADIRQVASSSGIKTPFLWARESSMNKYLDTVLKEQGEHYYTARVRLGGLYGQYAKYIIIRYPYQYFKYYYLPNMKQTFYPDIGCLYTNEIIKDEHITDYYRLKKSDTGTARHPFFSTAIYSYIRMAHLPMWAFIVAVGIVALIKRKQIKFSKEEQLIFWGFLLLAACFYTIHIFIASIEIRYILPMHFIQFAFCYILLTHIPQNSLFSYLRAKEKKC
jgi:hypothetical protein